MLRLLGYMQRTHWQRGKTAAASAFHAEDNDDDDDGDNDALETVDIDLAGLTSGAVVWVLSLLG